MNHFHRLSRALEDQEITSSLETEITIFTKIVDLAQLSTLTDFEDHEQLEARLITGGKVRVRKTTKSEGNNFALTLKTPSQAHGATQNNESNVPITDAVFENFRVIANQKWLKRRYRVPVQKTVITLNGKNSTSIQIDGLMYEVDVFKDSENRWVEWAKIDLETDVLLKALKKQYPTLKEFNLTIKLGKLPFRHTGAFIKESATPEQKAFLDQLFNDRYNLPVT